MYKHLTTILLTLALSALFPLITPASTPLTRPFNPSEPKAIEADMQELSELEMLVEKNGLSYETLQLSGAPNAQCLLKTEEGSVSLIDSLDPERERLLELPGFFWGLCCCFVGVFMVYVNIDEPTSRKKEGTQAIVGCVISVVLWSLLYLWVWASAN